MKTKLLKGIAAVCAVAFCACGYLVWDEYRQSSRSAEEFGRLAGLVDVGRTDEVSSIGIIGGADGPTSIFTSKNKPKSDNQSSETNRTETLKIKGSSIMQNDSYEESDGQAPQVDTEDKTSVGALDHDQVHGENKPESDESLLDPRILALRELAEKNSDMVGWVEIEGTKVNYPVMSNKDDPEYYLHRDFEKNNSKYGVPFLGVFCDPFKLTDNVIVYGHHMKDGSMFTGIMGYEKQRNHMSFYKRYEATTLMLRLLCCRFR